MMAVPDDMPGTCCAPTAASPAILLREATDAWVRKTKPDDPTFVLDPHVIARNVERFRRQIDAEVLYAVKCNPHKSVLKAICAAGVTRFDTASLSEIQTVKSLGRGVQCHFHHPIKSRRAIEVSAKTHSVRHFTIDSPEELQKLGEVLSPGGITLHVRIAVPSESACCGTVEKFGATEIAALRLLRQASRLGFDLGLSFHVGSQCRDPGRYGMALDALSNIVERADIQIGWINCGGGFPAMDDADGRDLFEAISDTLSTRIRELRKRTDARILVEPGRALVGAAASLIVRVHQRKGYSLYLNDGTYGALSKGCCGCEPRFSVRPIGVAAGHMSEFAIFGPTCDSTDRLQRNWLLPDGIAEGDWIEVATMGAYAGALSSRFNGFHRHRLITIADTM